MIKYKLLILVLLLISAFVTSLYCQIEKWKLYDSDNTPITNESINSIFVDDNNDKWIATDGLWIFNGKNWRIPENNIGLDTIPIRKIDKDKNGIYWITTYGNGLLRFNGNNWTKYDSSNTILFNNITSDIAIDSSNNIWVTNFFGDSIHVGIVYDILYKFDGEKWINMYERHNELKYLWIVDLLVDQNNALWLATLNYGIVKLEYDEVTLYNLSNSLIPSNRVYALELDSENNIWASFDDGMDTARGGLGKFDGESWTIYNTSNSDLPLNLLQYMVFDSKENLYISFNPSFAPLIGEDFIKYDGNNWETVEIPYDHNLIKIILDIQIDSLGNVLLATGSGLLFYNEDGVILNTKDFKPKTIKTRVIPTPFTNATIIEYAIDKPAHVKIDIYNTLGDKIETLVDEFQIPGGHEAVFDGDGLPAGVYYYKMRIGGDLESGRMVIVK